MFPQVLSAFESSAFQVGNFVPTFPKLGVSFTQLSKNLGNLALAAGPVASIA